MECDWEFDIAADAAVIDARWPGLVDLRERPELVSTLPEVVELPSLGRALSLLNSIRSPVWTSKCDVWIEEAFDPDELDSPADAVAFNRACYIDILARDPLPWSSADAVADWCRSTRTDLGRVPLTRCRADLVIRAAALRSDAFDFAVTAYFMACGATFGDADATLSRALETFATIAVRQPVVAPPKPSKYNEKVAGE